MQCVKCGTELMRSYNRFYEHTVKCSECNRKARKEEEQKRKKEAQAQKERHKILRFTQGEPKQIKLRLCANCNALIIGHGIYCSENCRKKAEYRTKEHVRRIRIRGRKHDNDITLHEVYRKDKGICYLCGEQCDWSDYTDQNGVFIAGNKYPSIDHVVALASGGTHEWGNVRLAHRWCNTIKSNT